MSSYSNLNLSRILESEEEEDELDRIMASHNAVVEDAQATSITVHDDGFDSTLSHLLEDDDEVVESTGEAAPPKVSPIGRKGEPNPHGPVNPERVTDVDAYYLAFLAMFRCATIDALRWLQYAGFNPKTRTVKRALPSARTVEDRFKKLARLGMASNFKNPVTGDVLWQATDRGIAAARAKGHLDRDDAINWEGVEGDEYITINHTAGVALFAARLLSPMSPYRDQFGVVTMNQLVNEGEIRRVYMPVNLRLAKERKTARELNLGSGQSFGEWRAEKINDVLKRLKSGALQLSEITELYPELWTMGQPDGDEPTKKAHWPDLVLSLEEGRTTSRSKSVAFEFELSSKGNDNLRAIQRTIAKELETPLIFGDVYYIGPKKIDKKLRLLHKDMGLDLYESGHLHFIELVDGNGAEVWTPTKVGE